ncbi:hypothetical protein GCK72_022362 [Caenorhabditis remanei]|uniref:Uncharacterized protein n=1 Tax=Caenorhabditis remanei TaxID=31234 RepID=A0A6A5FTV0_CAERE|nr:hypothetical protein GCK72_022362 [Caenorhabditis remanei]KAF1745915.1 hypothetical protein GCK72_022362 [Caenorhabditis remanei]
MPDVITTTVSALETPQVPSKYQTARNASKVYSDSISRRTQYSSKCTCTSPYHTNESFYHSQFKTYRNQVRWVMGGFVVFRQPLYLKRNKSTLHHDSIPIQPLGTAQLQSRTPEGIPPMTFFIPRHRKR